MFYQNVNGLRTKLVDLQNNINACLHDILILTETNLTPDVADSELGLCGFNVFRKDRSSDTSSKSSGGGVLIAVRSNLQASYISVTSCCIETIFVSIKTRSSPLLVGGVYIPPQQTSAVYGGFSSIVDEVMSSCPDPSCIVIAGDFNLPEVDWTVPAPTPSGGGSRAILELASTYDLYQVNTLRNARNVILDLILCSDPEIRVLAAPEAILPEEPAHPAIYCDIPLPKLQHSRTHTTRDFRRCDVEAVLHKLNRSLGPVMFYTPDIGSYFDGFLDLVHSVILECTPLKKTCSLTFPRWFSGELRRLILSKKIAHRRFKFTLDPNDYLEFSRLRSRCKALTDTCYSNYIAQVNEAIPLNMKSFWGFVNGLRVSSGVADTFHLDHRSESSSVGICNLFADHFGSVFTDYDVASTEYLFNSPINLSNCVLDEKDVEHKLSSLDPNKGTGPDEVPPCVLKHCSGLLAPHLTVIFNRFLECGIFPDRLKNSFVVPIHKSSDKSDVRNYRPVVIQPALGKVFESLVLDSISFQFRSVLRTQQHGFTPGRAVTSNLILYQQYIFSSFHNGCQVDSLYLDFSKAFDTVNHGLLLDKLKSYGILGSLLRWFRSYLADRSLMVKFSGGLSRPFVATSGVPQGSHLGPFLFTLFINDILEVIDVPCLLFADDVKLYCSVSKLEDCLRLQYCLRRIEDWVSTNLMTLNAGKCVIVSFHRSSDFIQYDYSLNGIMLKRDSSIRDLGIVFSSNLSFGAHIDTIVCKAARMLGFIIRVSRRGISTEALKFVYVSLVRSVLEYGSVIWSPYQIGHIEQLERIQERFLRVIGQRMGFVYQTVPLRLVGGVLGLDPLVERRKLHDLMFLHRTLNGEIDCPELLSLLDIRVPGRTRSADLFYRRDYSTSYEFHSTVPRLHRLGNLASPFHDFFNDSDRNLKRVFGSLGAGAFV